MKSILIIFLVIWSKSTEKGHSESLHEIPAKSSIIAFEDPGAKNPQSREYMLHIHSLSQKY